MIKKELLDIICCPACHGDLILSKDKKFLICSKCRIKYPIKEDIPILLIEESIKLQDDK
jgi:uncharacterized protein YbaR (Trm112 family)